MPMFRMIGPIIMKRVGGKKLKEVWVTTGPISTHFLSIVVTAGLICMLIGSNHTYTVKSKVILK